MTEREIFLSALEIEDKIARQAHVQAACGGDPTLLAKVESLLTLNDTPSRFLNVPIVKQLADELNSDSAATEFIANGSMQGEDSYAASNCHRSHPAGIAAPSDDADDEIQLGYLEPSTQPGSLGRLAHY